jgi:DNA topoisomerase IB
VYLDEAGNRLPARLAERCRQLAIPPAWQDVWICQVENGHLQAVGTDEAGRRQYLYHPDWRAQRDAEKHRRVRRFGRVLPRARQRLRDDLVRDGMPVERACATAVALLDVGYFRIGNDAYADEHGTFGLTTLERRHVRRDGAGLEFAFEGKSGVDQEIRIEDRPVVEAVEAMRRRRGGDHLLAWKDGRRWRSLEPQAVNDYVREITGMDATAKDFRTWHATVLAAAALATSDEPGESRASRKRAVAAAMKEVAEYLGNSPTMARSSYVDPGVVDAYEEGRTIHAAAHRRHRDPDERQAALERATLRLLAP